MAFRVCLRDRIRPFLGGVIRSDTKEDYFREALSFLEDSELIIVQEYFPTDFDWRVGVLDGKIIFVCKYFMARGHWQVAEWKGEIVREGTAECIPMDKVPPAVLKVALKVTRLIGRSFYGVDIKEVRGKAVVIEVNDNPNIEGGFEDALYKDQLYNNIIDSFLDRIREMHSLGHR